MRYQINYKLTTIGENKESFTKPRKNELAKLFNKERNWETKQGTLADLFSELFNNLPSFRLGIKETSNKKESCSEVWGIALDLDLKPSIDPKTKEEIKGCSVSATKKILRRKQIKSYFLPIFIRCAR